MLARHLAKEPLTTGTSARRDHSEWPTAAQLCAAPPLPAQSPGVDAEGRRSRETTIFSLGISPLVAPASRQGGCHLAEAEHYKAFFSQRLVTLPNKL